MSGLLSGVTAFHFRLLMESPWSGGAGYTVEQVGNMTLDQIHCRLCDIEVLKKPIGERTKAYDGISALGVLKPDEEGYIKGRDADGNPIKKKIGGKSLARQLMEQEQAKQQATKQEKKRRRRRK